MQAQLGLCFFKKVIFQKKNEIRWNNVNFISWRCYRILSNKILLDVKIDPQNFVLLIFVYVLNK